MCSCFQQMSTKSLPLPKTSCFNLGTFCSSKYKSTNQYFFTFCLKYLVHYLKINVGCSESVSEMPPVFLEYSHDSGRTWHLLREDCFVTDQSCADQFTEASMYYSGLDVDWQIIAVRLPEKITSRWAKSTCTVTA